MLTIPQPGDAFGRYDLVRELGRGGMGVVYGAVHRDLERDVALKLLSPDLADHAGYRGRFLREARTLARIDSPHVVRVHDAGEQDGWLFIVTELVPDGDLEQLLAQTGPLPAELGLDLVRQVADGLAEAHELGVLHRDVKPSNVLLRRLRNGDLRAVVCDFGIAISIDSDHTKTSGVIGTWGYLAPERLEGADATVASDVYALGCLLWTLLTGAPPYSGTAAQVALGHLQGPVRQLPGAEADVAALNVVLATAMAKDPAARFASVVELAAASVAAPAHPASAEATVLRTAVRTAPGPAPAAPTVAGSRWPLASGVLWRPALRQGTAGARYESPVVLPRSPADVTYAAAELPAGLRLDAATGVLGGATMMPGTYSVGLRAVRDGAEVAATELSLVVASDLDVVVSRLPDAAVGQPYDAEVSVTGGTGPLGWVRRGVLPDGLRGDTSSDLRTMRISGVPTRKVRARTSYTVRDRWGGTVEVPADVRVR